MGDKHWTARVNMSHGNQVVYESVLFYHTKWTWKQLLYNKTTLNTY